MTDVHVVYIIGYNGEGQCGLNTEKDIEELTLISNKEITRFFPGYSQTIFGNDDLSKLWSAGFNDGGQCGINNRNRDNIIKATMIEYFDKHDIKIDRIYNHIIGERVFYVSKSA